MRQSSTIVPFPRSDDEIETFPVETPTIQRLRAEQQKRRTGRFVKGPIPWPAITAATKAHPRGPALYLAIKMRIDTSHMGEVTIPKTLCAELGIDREMKRRVLKALADAGLIEVIQEPGRPARARLSASA